MWKPHQLYLASYQCQDERDIKAIYDQWAPDYDHSMSNLNWQAPTHIAHLLAQALQNTTRAHARVLDVGAGTGQVGVALQPLGFASIDAFDISDTMLSHAKARNVYKNIITGNAEKLDDYIDGKYQAIVCVGALNFGHISPHALTRFIAATAPGGYICFSTREDFYQTSSKEVQDHLTTSGQWHLVEERPQKTSVNDMPHRHWLYRV